MIGRETGWVDVEWTGFSPEHCFFFGCGSSGLLDRCFDRTGTGVVDTRVVTREVSGTDVGLEVVSDDVRFEDGGVWGKWLDDRRHCVDDW